MTLSWDDGKDLLKTSQFKGYHVWLSKRGDIAEHPLMRTTKENTYVWTLLESAQGYEVRVTLATNDFGESEKSGPVNFLTQENTDSEKSAIDNLRVIVDDNNRAYQEKFTDIKGEIATEIATINTAIGDRLLTSVYDTDKANYVLDTTLTNEINTIDTNIKNLDSTYVKNDGTYTNMKNLVTNLNDVCIKPGETNYQNILTRLNDVEDVVWFDAYGKSFWSHENYWKTMTYSGNYDNSHGGLNRGSGIFTVPKKGTYQFIFQAYKWEDCNAEIKILINGQERSYAKSNDNSGNDGMTITATQISTLNKGDEVKVDVKGEFGLKDNPSSYYLIHFTGVLLTTK